MDTLRLPKQPASSTHEVIVVPEGVHLAIDQVDTGPRTHEIISYHRVSEAQDIRSRIQCASIVITAQAFITAESLGDAPNLRCVVTPTSGINHIDVDECRRRGIKVAKCPGLTSPSAAEHALSLYFAARRRTVMLHNEIRNVDENGENAWKRQHSIAAMMQTANGHPPCSLEEEVVGIIGHGDIGKRLEAFCKALGMKVLIAMRKGAPPIQTATASNGDVNTTIQRVPFDEIIRAATVLFVSCVANEATRNMIDTPELGAMRPEVVIINISRGSVMNTAEVVRALREGRISGAATDVYDREPASTEADSAFLAESTRDLNLTLSPHVGYFSTKTMALSRLMVSDRIKKFVSGDFRDFVV